MTDVGDDDPFFPELRRVSRRLELDEMELVEAMICSLDNGEPYWAALHGAVVAAAQRRGMYDGEIKARIDSGDFYGLRPVRIPETPGRLAESVAEGHIDIFDALAAVGAQQEAAQRIDGETEFQRRRDAKLANVKNDEGI